MLRVHLCVLLCVIVNSSATISEEKCDEYSREFLDDTIEVPRPGGWSPLGKVPASFGEFPHAAHLGFEGDGEVQWACGGSLISEQFVLTAAHCARSRLGSQVKYVKLGAHDESINAEDSDVVQTFNVTTIINHPRYKPPSRYHDIALIKLDRPVKMTYYIRPACLYTKFSIPLSIEVSAVGWGLLEMMGKPSENLQKVYLNLFSHDECTKPYQAGRPLQYGILKNLMVCAGGRKSNRGSCQGDSGGPLQLLNKDKNIYEIIGVSSFSAACAILEVPGVHTRVAAYVPWIEYVVWGGSDLSALEMDSAISATNAAPNILC